MSDTGAMNAQMPAGSRRRLPLLALAAVIVALLFQFGGKPFAAGLIAAPWDKPAHFIAYATIAVLLRFGIGGRHPWRLVPLVAAIGGLDEWLQRSLPGRSADPADLATDVLAAIVAIAGCEWWTTLRRARRLARSAARQADPATNPASQPAANASG